jgi:hypothetical protein
LLACAAPQFHFVYEMYVKGPDGKEYKTMDIAYERKS